MMNSNFVYIFLFVLFASSGCGKKTSSSTFLETSSEMSREAWADRVARFVRNGSGLNPDRDDIQALLAKQDEQLIEQLMTDKRFETVLQRMMMYYLNRPTDDSTQLSMGSQPLAILSAKEVFEGRSLLSVINWSPNVRLGEPTAVKRTTLIPLPLPTDDGDGTIVIPDSDQAALPGNLLLDEEKSFEFYRKKVNDNLDAIIKSATEFQQGQEIYKFCSTVYMNLYNAKLAIDDSGFPAALRGQLGFTWFNGGDYYVKCLTPANPRPELSSIQELKSAINKIYDLVKSARLDPRVRNENINLVAPNLSPLVTAFTTQGFWTPLRNSSTNYNRKRAAYILKTFFCDDLTPIDIAMPESHATGAHGTDPKCMSCHYKLDPIGGLFRNHGAGGLSTVAQGKLTFDDFKVIEGEELKNYLNSWNDPDTGKPKVGFYVAPGKLHEKWQGDNVASLLDFIRESSETRACLVRRIAEFTTSRTQAMDGYFLKSLTEDLNRESESGGVRQVLKRLLMSKTFKQKDPDPSQCYDVMNASGTPRPECRIDFIVERSCVGCHQSGGGTRLGLNKWIKLPSGEFTFEHLNAAGVQLQKKESFKIILERLSAPDPRIRMPRGGVMADRERQVLYKWLDAEINR